jgi:4-carboxymuconolactone decarboxylase
MKLLAGTVMSLSLLASAFAQTNPGGDAQTVTIARSGSQPARKGPAENFTGSVRVDPLFQATDPSRSAGAYVTFEPGARTAWHTHPLGQRLIVTAGAGRVQQWGGPIEEIRAGDVVWIPPGVKHWHGAGPDSAMTHIAITEHLDGKTVDWLERVSDAEYGKLPQVHAGASPSTAAPSVRGATVQPTPAQQMLREVAPKLAELTDDVLFGDVWERPGLSKRDRTGDRRAVSPRAASVSPRQSP